MRGKSGHVPFWPGGLDDILLNPEISADANNQKKKGLRTVPPGLSRGLHLPGDEVDEDALLALDELGEATDKTAETDSVITLFLLVVMAICIQLILFSLMEMVWMTPRQTFHSVGRRMRLMTCCLHQ